ncbi:MAG: hypothetical protein ABIJ91_05695 [Candidatus Kuenenbacteria bacterium]
MKNDQTVALILKQMEIKEDEEDPPGAPSSPNFNKIKKKSLF